MPKGIHFSFLVFANAPRANTSLLAKQLGCTMASLKAQPIKNWDACIIVSERHQKTIFTDTPETDQLADQIIWRSVNESIDHEHSEQSLIKKTKGNWIGFLYAGDVVREDFLYWMIRAITSRSEPVDVIRFASHSDNRKLHTPSLPIWSADLQWESNYLDNDFVVSQSVAVKSLKPFPIVKPRSPGFSNTVVGLANRLVTMVREFDHADKGQSVRAKVCLMEQTLLCKPSQSIVRDRLLHSSQALNTRRADVKRVLTKTGVKVSLNQRQQKNWFSIVWPAPKDWPSVHLVILTRDRFELISRCLESLVQHTQYPKLRITVIDNGSQDPQARDYLSQLSYRNESLNIEVIRDERPFNFSALNNSAVKETQDGVLVFLNNDIEILTPNWLKTMVRHALRKDVGCVGAKLLYPDGTIQHLGVLLGGDHIASHLYRSVEPSAWPADDPLLSCTSNPAAVTAAAMAIEATKFHAVGGFNEWHLAVAYNDVDLCLKLETLGYRSVCLPDVTMTHLESATRDSDMVKQTTHASRLRRERKEFNWMRQHWHARITQTNGNRFT